jgi:hypothetical protein
MVAVLMEYGAAAGSFHQVADGASFRSGGAPGDGEGKAALDRVKVGALREGETELVPEGGADGGVVYGPGRGLAECLLELGPCCRVQVAVGVKGVVDRLG